MLRTNSLPPDGIRIGVFGGATDPSAAALAMASTLGRVLARKGVITVTGATSGIPHAAGTAALAAGGTVLGISPARNAEEHLRHYDRPLTGCTHIFWTGHGFTGRNYLNIRNCDVALFLGGEWGTLEELCIAVSEAKIVGVLEGSGGITSVVRDIQRQCRSNPGEAILFADDPEVLLVRVLAALGIEAGQQSS